MPLMKYRISVTLEFLREMKHLSKRYKSLKEDLRNFGNDLLLNPEQGVSLGNNLRKIRIAITSKNKGKRRCTGDNLYDNLDRNRYRDKIAHYL